MQLNPFHKNFCRNARCKAALRSLRERNDHTIAMSYSNNVRGELARLCQKYGTDKGAVDTNVAHNYPDFYELILAQKREYISHVLECGIGTVDLNQNPPRMPGASLRVWQEYFPRAQIVGIDIESDILFQEERIATYQCDQTDPQSIRAFLAKLDDRKFDVIIDDGLHKPHAGITLFENCIDRLTDDGVYVIEDVSVSNLVRYGKYFDKKQYAVRYVNLHRPHKRYLSSNSLVVISKSFFNNTANKN